jgi:Cu(I)/Ag(I) efflux system membrane fusion protein
MRKITLTNMVVIVAIFTLLSGAALAAMDHGAHGMGGHNAGGTNDAGHGMESSAQSSATRVFSTKGVIQEIAGSKITIAHEAVPALRWPAMVMRFTVESAELLEGFKTGDKVSFDFRPQGSDFIIVGME